MFRKKRKSKEEYAPVITLRSVKDSREKYQYHLKGCMVIGRDAALCDIAFPDNMTVSSRQCRLYTEEGDVYLMDLEGTNATYVNNQKVTDDVILRNGDTIGFGNADYYIMIK